MIEVFPEFAHVNVIGANVGGHSPSISLIQQRGGETNSMGKPLVRPVRLEKV
jgi:hypothetical protein